jgi:hypothetical protein
MDTKVQKNTFNNEIGNSSQVDYPTSLKKGNEKTSNPQDMANMLNSYFIESADELLVNNLKPYVSQISNARIINQLTTMFWLPVTEMEIERVIKSLRGKPYLANGVQIVEIAIWRKIILRVNIHHYREKQYMVYHRGQYWDHCCFSCTSI